MVFHLSMNSKGHFKHSIPADYIKECDRFNDGNIYVNSKKVGHINEGLSIPAIRLRFLNIYKGVLRDKFEYKPLLKKYGVEF